MTLTCISSYDLETHAPRIRVNLSNRFTDYQRKEKGRVPIGVKATTCEAPYCRDVPSICSHSRFAGYIEYPRVLICVHRGGKRLELSDTGAGRKSLLPMIRGSEPSLLRMANSQKETQTIRVTVSRFLGRKRERIPELLLIRPLRLSR
jgi:hypothetical protein